MTQPRIVDVVMPHLEKPIWPRIALAAVIALLAHVAVGVYCDRPMAKMRQPARPPVQVTMQPRPPPLPPPKVEPPPEPEPTEPQPSHAPAQPRAPVAKVAKVLTRTGPAGGANVPTVVSGHGNVSAGGASGSEGTGERPGDLPMPVPLPKVELPQEPVEPEPDRSKPASLAADDFHCAWPDEAGDADIDQQTVTFRALVQADGSVEAVKIVSDPGQGFGAAAQKCLLRTNFQPAKDRHGQATRAWSMAIRVHFVR